VLSNITYLEKTRKEGKKREEKSEISEDDDNDGKKFQY
jgi:hypothetical protein